MVFLPTRAAWPLLKRRSEPQDIAYAAVWLASDEARYVTGADIPVDAGATAW